MRSVALQITGLVVGLSAEDLGVLDANASARRMQVAHTFLMSELRCEWCCKEEWRSCLCMLSCDILQDQCQGVTAVETCNVLRGCYERIDEASPKGFDFDWQCKLMQCMAYCLKHEEVCNPIHQRFMEICHQARQNELDTCGVVCSSAWRLLAWPVSWAFLLWGVQS
ncbi:unnamed protein product [Durusdinium trenchii]|uniref:Uncharacterized protein n=1 Tax=Durusdinium trenchii TaxID=1381693 RepID=A0ABP0LNW1_9DINO